LSNLSSEDNFQGRIKGNIGEEPNFLVRTRVLFNFLITNRELQFRMLLTVSIDWTSFGIFWTAQIEKRSHHKLINHGNSFMTEPLSYMKLSFIRVNGRTFNRFSHCNCLFWIGNRSKNNHLPNQIGMFKKWFFLSKTGLWDLVLGNPNI
jgi:hypothetical protein